MYFVYFFFMCLTCLFFMCLLGDIWACLGKIISRIYQNTKMWMRAIVVAIASYAGIYIAITYSQYKSEIDWFCIFDLTVFLTIIFVWIYLSNLYYLEEQHLGDYFPSLKCYRNVLEQYERLVRSNDIRNGEWWGRFFYYFIWLMGIIYLVIAHMKLDLMPHRIIWGERVFGVLLAFSLFLCGNSSFAGFAYTNMLRLFYNELRKEGFDPRKNLDCNLILPAHISGITKLVERGRSNSIAYLSVSLMYISMFFVGIWEHRHNNIQERLIQEPLFQGIIAVFFLMTVGLYLICTVGPKYYLQRIVDLFKMETTQILEGNLSKLQDALLTGKSTNEELGRIAKYKEFIKELSDERIRLFSSRAEIVLTIITICISIFSIIVQWRA